MNESGGKESVSEKYKIVLKEVVTELPEDRNPGDALDAAIEATARSIQHYLAALEDLSVLKTCHQVALTVYTGPGGRNFAKIAEDFQGLVADAETRLKTTMTPEVSEAIERLRQLHSLRDEV